MSQNLQMWLPNFPLSGAELKEFLRGLSTYLTLSFKDQESYLKFHPDFKALLERFPDAEWWQK